MPHTMSGTTSWDIFKFDIVVFLTKIYNEYVFLFCFLHSTCDMSFFQMLGDIRIMCIYVIYLRDTGLNHFYYQEI
jgi:hypothetical protein